MFGFSWLSVARVDRLFEFIRVNGLASIAP